MNYGPLVFLVSFLAISVSWFGLILKPQVQIGSAQAETNIVATSEMYPLGRPGMAREGADVYRSLGCAACHSQQVGQSGIVVDVMLTGVGSNAMAVANALVKDFGMKVSGPGLAAGLPRVIVNGTDIDAANAAIKELEPTGAKLVARIVPVGPDIARGWGVRRTVAADYLYDSPVLLGSQRVGPDLANVGARLPDVNWQLAHLYSPQAFVKGSPMPPYRFLFEKKKLAQGAQPSGDAVKFLNGAGEPGYEIVPKSEARQLVAYLLSLRAETPIFEAPLSGAPASTTATNTAAK
jgi:cbb3-type cytochrome oxidase cytochrome c subunit